MRSIRRRGSPKTSRACICIMRHPDAWPDIELLWFLIFDYKRAFHPWLCLAWSKLEISPKGRGYTYRTCSLDALDLELIFLSTPGSGCDLCTYKSLTWELTSTCLISSRDSGFGQWESWNIPSLSEHLYSPNPWVVDLNQLPPHSHSKYTCWHTTGHKSPMGRGENVILYM